MRHRPSIIFAIATLLLLGGCGKRASLQPAVGESLPVAPATATRPPTADELLVPPVQAEPKRVDETLTKSEEREDDRFDLPPT